MRAVITPSVAQGSIKVPPSKSMAHRHIICAALAQGMSVISNVDFSEDILATLDCITALGAHVLKQESCVSIEGIDINNLPKEVDFMCRESGSTMRFFMGIAMTFGIKGHFYGSQTLRSRPFGIYESLCEEQGIRFVREEDSILVDGKLDAGCFNIKGNVSSQFITGLLFGLPLQEADSVINLIPPVESRSYLDLTLKAMSDSGVEAVWDDENTITIKSCQRYLCRNISVEGDFSNGAFLDAFNTIGGCVDTIGLKDDSLQGDRVYKDLFIKLAAGKPVIDISDCPDLGPILFCVAASLNGAIFTGTRRLKMKESDRGSVMCEELSKLSVATKMDENSIEIGVIDRRAKLSDVVICGHNDHRIVMSFAFLLSLTGGTIDEAQAVRKSYPGFFEDIRSLGINVELEMED